MQKFNRRSALFILSAVFVCAPVLAATETPASIDGASVISARQALDKQGAGAVLVDTRVASEYAERTAQGAVNIPYREKSAKSVDFDPSEDRFNIGKLPQDKSADIVLFCNSGTCWKSYKAVHAAVAAGYTNVHWMRNGMPEWIENDLPTQ